MIKSFRVMCLTSKGEEALQRNLDEFARLPPQSKLMLKTLYTREVSHNPLTLLMRIKNNVLAAQLDPHDVKRKLELSMKNEGAVKNVDYKIEVEKQ